MLEQDAEDTASLRWPGFGSATPFYRMLDKLPVAAYICNTVGQIVYFNQHAVDLWGRQPKLNDQADRFCGSFELFSAEGTPIPHDQCWMALALKSGQEFNGQEIIIKRPDGVRLTVLAHVNPIRDESGTLIGAINILIDIQERQQSEQVRALLASIVESSEDAIVSKTLEGKILTWNAGAEKLFGYTAAEAVGQPITMLIPPELLDTEQDILARLRRGERIEHFETERIKKSGQRIDISLSISPMRDSTGRIIGASKVARDISARKQSEAALDLAKNEMVAQLADLRRLQAMSVQLSTTLELKPILQETLRTATAMEGTDLGFLSLCDEEERHLRIGASVGFAPEILSALDSIAAGSGACGRAMQMRGRVIIEDIETDAAFAPHREIARAAGVRAIHSTPLVTRAGKLVGVLSTHFRKPHRPSDREMHLIDLCARQAVDFIENAQLYTRLREADRRKDEFLAILAHELRNPLAPLSNSLNLLKITGDSSPAAKQVYEIMERQVGHMVRLVDDLLEVSRITRGKIELRKESVNLATVISSAVETSRPLIEAAQHRLVVELPDETIGLEADPVRLTQVISNLLNNAAKYTDAGGTIWLNARRDGNEAVVSVRDTGVGIPPEMLRRVFDMFAQVDGGLDRAQGGLGIGLTLAKSLVQMHGGRIEARSGGIGHGSEFVVRLPVAASVAVPMELARPADATVTRRRILVVDDTRAAVFTLGKLLETMGQEVQTANDAPTALGLAQSNPPEVIISDIAMPEMNGYELARRVRQEPAMEGVILVALTGYGQESDRQRAHEAGFNHHLVKPVSLPALEKLLASLPDRDKVLSTLDG